MGCRSRADLDPEHLTAGTHLAKKVRKAGPGSASPVDDPVAGFEAKEGSSALADRLDEAKVKVRKRSNQPCEQPNI